MERTSLAMIEHAAHSAAKMERLFAHPRLAHWLLIRTVAPRLVDADPGWGRQLRTSLLKTGGVTLPVEAIPALREAMTATRKMHESAAKAHVSGEPVVWFTWPVPAAVIAAFGVTYFCPENFYSVANATGGDGSTRMCEVADRHGVPQEICSINRCVIGAHLAGELPTPTLCITANTPCDGNHAGNTIIRELARCEQFSVGGAYDRSPETIAVWAKSVWELIEFLEKRLGRPMDWELLASYAENLNRVNSALNKVTEMHRAMPAPRMINTLAVFWRVVGGAGWEPPVARGAELLLQGAEQILMRNRQKKAPRERMRVLLGDQAIAWTDPSSWLWKEYGAAVVSDYIGSFRHPAVDTSTRESLIEGLALDRLHFSMVRQAHGTMEYTLDELETTIREYQADCVVFHSNTGCKHNLALRREVDETCRAAGVPACFLDVDIVDRRVMSEEAIKQKLRAFFAANGLPK